MSKTFNLVVKVDTNDADFITEHYPVTSDEATILTELFRRLKPQAFGGYNWDVEDGDMGPVRELYQDVYTDEEFNYIKRYIPDLEGYTRGVESVKLIPIGSEIIVI